MFVVLLAAATALALLFGESPLYWDNLDAFALDHTMNFTERQDVRNAFLNSASGCVHTNRNCNVTL